MPSHILTDDSLALTTAVPLTRHPAAVYLSMLGKGSRSTMRQSLNTIAALLTNGECDALTLDWAALRYEHTAAVQGALLEKHEPTTVKKMMCALRRVLREAYKLRLIDLETYEAAVDLPPVRLNKRLRGRALSQDEIAALISVCQNDPTPQGIRDAALLGILRGAGLRRAEVVKLKLGDFEPEIGSLEIRCAKGGKDRTVYLPEEVIPLVLDWLEIRGYEPGALLYPILKNGRIELRQMTPQAVLLIVRRRAKQAGVESFSPHDLRRTFCSDLLDAGVDIVTVQKLAGHNSPTTTAKYDRRGEEAKRKAVQQLKIGAKKNRS
ncbi:MAG: phage integrase family protein [Symploca sp. SIO2G7]|nr:phage integrase family protein [Symploca sp. SIO2G7]